jgi:hypothetical protein
MHPPCHLQKRCHYDHGGMTFDATETFSVKCTYQINQRAHMVVNLEDLILEPLMGSELIPSDVPSLVGHAALGHAQRNV